MMCKKKLTIPDHRQNLRKEKAHMPEIEAHYKEKLPAGWPWCSACKTGRANAIYHPEFFVLNPQCVVLTVLWKSPSGIKLVLYGFVAVL